MIVFLFFIFLKRLNTIASHTFRPLIKKLDYMLLIAVVFRTLLHKQLGCLSALVGRNSNIVQYGISLFEQGHAQQDTDQFKVMTDIYCQVIA